MATLAARITALAEAIRDKLNTMTPKLVPPGGTTGQALVKSGDGDHALAWDDMSGGGGWTDLAVVTPGAVAAVDFAPIPQTYSDLRIVLEGVSHDGGTTQRCTIAYSDESGTYSNSDLVSALLAASTVTLYGSIDLTDYRADAGGVAGTAGNISSSPVASSDGGITRTWRCDGGIHGLRIAFSGGANFDGGTLRLRAR